MTDWSEPRFEPRPGFERVLLFSTRRWFSTARLAHALLSSGFRVHALTPPRHPLRCVRGLERHWVLPLLYPLRQLRRAVDVWRPDLILPDDEHALLLLGALRAQGGSDASQGCLRSRTGAMSRAGALGIAVPRGRVLDAPQLKADEDFPLVLKTDGSWGGRGVMLIERRKDLERAWTRLRRVPPLWRVLLRFLVDRDVCSFLQWKAGRHATVNLQQHVAGRPGFVTTLSIEGQMLACICFEVIDHAGVLGPATVVRVVAGPDMEHAARLLVREWRLSGFAGLDFMIDDEGCAVLVEINARATPTSHLLLEPAPAIGSVLALYPQAWMRGVEGLGIPDVPNGAPDMMRLGNHAIARSRGIPAQLGRRLRRIISINPEAGD